MRGLTAVLCPMHVAHCDLHVPVATAESTVVRSAAFSLRLCISRSAFQTTVLSDVGNGTGASF